MPRIGSTASKRNKNVLKKISYNPTLKPDDAAIIIRVAVRYCVLPHPYVVSQLNGAVFPVFRGNAKKRLKEGSIDGKPVMYDDNTAPRWALLWAHGYLMAGFPPGGWTFAHVWDKSNDPEAYTHVANLVMMLECLGSLSDKKGPLTEVLRYHSLSKYDLCPKGESDVKKPNGYDDLQWNYFRKISNPRDQVYSRLRKSKAKRVNPLRRLFEQKIQV